MSLNQKNRRIASTSAQVTRERLDRWTLLQGVNDGSEVRMMDDLVGGVAATVPGSVLGVLVERGVVADVTVNGTEEELEWVSSCSWIYRTEVPRRVDGAASRLVFEGVDTLATIRVDGVVVQSTDDMFHSWVVDLGTDAVPGAWVIEVEFDPALPVANAAEASQPFPRADMYEIPFNQVRKMACSFGWDWGPVTNTAGLWREVTLERTPRGRINRALLEGTWRDAAVLIGTVSCEGNLSHLEVVVKDAEGALVESESFPVVGDVCEFVLHAPRASQWNVVGRGAQPLYSVELIAYAGDGEVVDTVTRRLGFRLLELIQAPDEIGASFAFHVNGARVWARGFNWIPADVLPERVTRDKVRALILDVMATGANMLRVWGGGVVESDDFYDACDEMGILVWQDFSFACAAYPEDDVQAARVTREVEDAVERVGYRTSLALWCGCNENLWGHEDWGWKDKLGEDGPWGARLYFEVIPEALSTLDRRRPYVPGSPFSPGLSAHPNDQTTGTTHHWDTWNEIDYTDFESKYSRFASEFGWQAPASWPTLSKAIGGAPQGADDPRIVRLQKAYKGAESLSRGITSHLDHLPDDGPHWYAAAQLVQARALRASIGRFRSLHDSCSGALWWQFDDCWPALSWSVVDVAGRRKLAWYAATEVMAPRAVLGTAEGSATGLTLVNDTPTAWEAEVVVRVINDAGEVLSAHTTAVALPADSHRLIEPRDVHEGAVAVVVDVDGSRSARWLVDDASLRNQPTRARVRKVSDDAKSGTTTIEVEAVDMLRDLSLHTERIIGFEDATVDRQLFLLLPGETARFTVTGAAPSAMTEHNWGAVLAASTEVSLVSTED